MPLDRCYFDCQRGPTPPCDNCVADNKAVRKWLESLAAQIGVLSSSEPPRIHIVRSATRWADLVPDGHAELLAAALACATRGWRVFPLMPALVDDRTVSEDFPFKERTGKVPAIKHWKMLASTDSATIKAWWDTRRGANVGIATGAGSDLTVVDVDVKTAKDGTVIDGRIAMLRLEQAHGDLPLGPRVRRGLGPHLYFRHVPALTNSVGILPGVDIRSEAGLVVAAESFHRGAGERYRFVPGTAELAVPAMPTWLVDTLLAAQDRGGKTSPRPRPARVNLPPSGNVAIPVDASDAETRARRYVAKMPASVSGDAGHMALWTATCRAMHGFEPGLDDQTVYRVLIDVFNARCEPPWSERELLHKIEGARALDEPKKWRVENARVAALGVEEMA